MNKPHLLLIVSTDISLTHGHLSFASQPTQPFKMADDPIGPESHQHGHLREVEWEAHFPRLLIQNFAFAAVGQFTLSIAANGDILSAKVPLDDSLYKHLLVDDPKILKLFVTCRNRQQDLNFNPMTKFRLDSIIPPDQLGEDDPWPDTARLVDVSNLPTEVAFSHRPIELWGPTKGAVYARLEKIWGTKRDRVETHKETLSTKNNPSKRRRANGLSVLRSPPANEVGSAVATDVASGRVPPHSIASKSETRTLDREVGLGTRDIRSATSHVSTDNGSSEGVSTAAPSARPKFHDQNNQGHQNGRSDAENIAVAAVLALSVSNHGCEHRRMCSTCCITPCLPWLPIDANGREMARILV